MNWQERFISIPLIWDEWSSQQEAHQRLSHTFCDFLILLNFLILSLGVWWIGKITAPPPWVPGTSSKPTPKSRNPGVQAHRQCFSLERLSSVAFCLTSLSLQRILLNVSLKKSFRRHPRNSLWQSLWTKKCNPHAGSQVGRCLAHKEHFVHKGHVSPPALVTEETSHLWTASFRAYWGILLGTAKLSFILVTKHRDKHLQDMMFWLFALNDLC